MKRLALLLFVLSAISLKGQTIGVIADYGAHANLTLKGDGYYHQNLVNSGIYYSSRPWKRFNYSTGVNFLTGISSGGFMIEPWYMGAPDNASSYTDKTIIMELPVDISFLATRNLSNKCHVYLHMGYGISTHIAGQRSYFTNNHSFILSDKVYIYPFAQNINHNIRAEIEFRWNVLKRYTSSFFICNRHMAIKTPGRYYDWAAYLGTGLRFGFILPKKAKE